MSTLLESVDPSSPIRRTTTLWRWIGVGLGVVAAAVTESLGTLGRGPMLAAPVLALATVGGVAVGEWRAARLAAVGTDTPREALLETRRLRTYLPRALSIAVAGAAVVLAALATSTTLIADADDLGRSGRALAFTCTGGGGEQAGSGAYDSLSVVVGSTGPFPGSFYTAPLAIVVLAGLALVGVALLRVLRRPRQVRDPLEDDALRARSATAVVASFGVLVSTPLAGVAAFAGSALSRTGSAIAQTRAALVDQRCSFGASLDGRVLIALAVLAGLLACWCLAALLLPAPPGRARLGR